MINEYIDIYNIKSTNAFSIGMITLIIMTCINSINTYYIWLEILNKDEIVGEYNWFGSIKRWYHVIKCEKIIEIGKEFKKELLNKL